MRWCFLFTVWECMVSCVCIAETKSELKLVVQKGHSGFIKGLCYSPDGKHIVSGSSDKTLIIWDARTGQQIHSRTGFFMPVDAIDFSPNSNKFVITGRVAKTAEVWDLQSGKKLQTLQRHPVKAARFCPDGKQIVTGSYEDAVIWDAQSGKEIHILKGHTDSIQAVDVSPDGKHIVTGS